MFRNRAGLKESAYRCRKWRTVRKKLGEAVEVVEQGNRCKCHICRSLCDDKLCFDKKDRQWVLTWILSIISVISWHWLWFWLWLRLLDPKISD